MYSKKESIPKELLDAFKAMDSQRRGYIPARDLWNILVKWGEKLSPREGMHPVSPRVDAKIFVFAKILRIFFAVCEKSLRKDT
jgi:hypothetical protein